MGDNPLLGSLPHPMNFSAAIAKLGKDQGLKFVVESGNYQPVTFNLDNVPLELAIDEICKCAGAKWSKINDVYHFSPKKDD